MMLALACVGFLGTSDSAGDTSLDESGGGDDPLCATAQDSGAPSGPDCFSGTLGCGGAVTGTTAGGLSTYETADYGHLFCFTDLASQGYTGSERVYFVDLGDGVNAHARLDASCGDMGLSALRWSDSDRCPDSEGSATACEGAEGAGSITVVFGGFPENNTWAIVVDTAGAEAEPFRLSIDCG
ncbi:MAG: hypothetical protein EXR71_07135 [Myxococcales bacterium]|nr:hypothetical protein [Myxococcales bacterium]